MPDGVQRKPCHRCQRPILWARTKDQTPIPLDIEPVSDAEGGIYFLTQAGAAVHVDTFCTKEERAGRRFYRPHRLSCPQAGLWPGRPPVREPVGHDG